MFDPSLESGNDFSGLISPPPYNNAPFGDSVNPFAVSNNNLGSSLDYGLRELEVSSPTDPNLIPSVQQAANLAQDKLTDLALNPQHDDLLGVAFGNNYNQQEADSLLQNFAQDDFSNLPKVQIISSDILGNANGAYAKALDTIFLSDQFVSSHNSEEIAGVLLEEIGHGIDHRINSVDAVGDEGDIFSRLVRGESIYSADLALLKQEDDSSSILFNGQAVSIEKAQIAIESFNGRLYQSHRGTDNKIYTRSSSDGQNWTSWKETGGTTYSAVALESVNGRLYQSHRGTNNEIYTRSSADGVNWTSWHTDYAGATYNAVDLEVFNKRLYQTHQGTDNKIYTRSSTDGVNWTGWKEGNTGGETPTELSLGSFNGKLYQVHQGMNQKIYTRSSYDGITWTGWDEDGGLTNIHQFANSNPTGSGTLPAIMTQTQFDNWVNMPEYTTRNPFPSKGKNCTWYAHGRMMQLGYSEYALDSMLGNAGTWDNYASRGCSVSTTPKVGTIAVWEAYVNGAGSVGHVGVVERVNADGTITISESNWAGKTYNVRTIAANNPSKFIVVPKA